MCEEVDKDHCRVGRVGRKRDGCLWKVSEGCGRDEEAGVLVDGPPRRVDARLCRPGFAKGGVVDGEQVKDAMQLGFWRGHFDIDKAFLEAAFEDAIDNDTGWQGLAKGGLDIRRVGLRIGGECIGATKKIVVGCGGREAKEAEKGDKEHEASLFVFHLSIARRLCRVWKTFEDVAMSYFPKGP